MTSCIFHIGGMWLENQVYLLIICIEVICYTMSFAMETDQLPIKQMKRYDNIAAEKKANIYFVSKIRVFHI